MVGSHPEGPPQGFLEVRTPSLREGTWRQAGSGPLPSLSIPIPVAAQGKSLCGSRQAGRQADWLPPESAHKRIKVLLSGRHWV